MKKIILTTIISSMFITANASNIDKQLKYIPSDTALFFANLKFDPRSNELLSLYLSNQSFKEYLTSISEAYNGYRKRAGTDNIDEPPVAKFFFTIIKDLADNINNSKSANDLFDFYGIDKKSQGLIYLIGASPVIKIKSDNPDKLWTYLDKLENDSGFKHIQKKLDNLSYRYYHTKEEPDVGVIFSHADGYLTIALELSGNSDDFLPIALGQKSAPKPLNKSDRFKELKSKYGKKHSTLGYLNLTEILKVFTTKDGNRISKHINTSMGDDVISIDNQACRDEITTMVNNWPQIDFMGAYSDTRNNLTLSQQVIYEGNSKKILSAIADLSGHIPDFTNDDSILSLGLGIDVAKLANVANTIYSETIATNYQCPMIAEIKQSIPNPAALGIFTGMAQGIKGLGVSVYDFEFDQSNMQIKTIDFLKAFAVEDSSILINTLIPFLPQELAQLDTSKPIKINQYIPQELPANIDVYLSVKDNWVSIYSGKQAEKAEKDLGKDISPNNLLRFSYNQAKIYNILKAFDKKYMYSDLPLKAKSDLYIKDDGIYINANTTLEK